MFLNPKSLKDYYIDENFSGKSRLYDILKVLVSLISSDPLC